MCVLVSLCALGIGLNAQQGHRQHWPCPHSGLLAFFLPCMWQPEHDPAIHTSLPSLAAKSRAILLPLDLDAHMSALLSSGGSCAAAAQRSAANYKTATRTFPRAIPTANQWDYKNIIEKLQVGMVAWSLGRVCSSEGSLLPLGRAACSAQRVGRGHAPGASGQVVTSPPALPGHHHSPGGAAEASGAGGALRARGHAALARAALSGGQ